MILVGSSSGSRRVPEGFCVVGGEAFEELVEVLFGIGPVERPGGEVVVVFERGQAGLHIGEVWKSLGVTTLRCTTEK
jgi:hypothetical protein